MVVTLAPLRMRQPTVSIAVKPSSNTEVPEEAKRVLRNELQVKYLESIGAAPTKANLALLRKNIPPETIRFTTAWKSNLAGEPDYLKVFFQDLPTPAEKSPRTHATDGVIELSSVLDHPPADPPAEEEDAGPGWVRASGINFDEARSSYLYPFKSVYARRRQVQQLAASTTAPAALRTGGRRARRVVDDEPRAPPPPRKYVCRDSLRYQQYAEEDVELELQEELRLHTKEIVALQAQFIRLFPFERLKERLTADDLRITVTEISSKRTARFIGMLTLFLYWHHIAPKASRTAPDAQLSQLFCAVQQYFTSVRNHMRRRRALLMNALPVLLLSVRMAVEGLLRGGFPKWWTTVDGAETLARVDLMIEQMFDPNAYHSHITPLESTSEAIRIAARDELFLKPRSRGARYLATSSIVTTALPHAPLVVAHRHIAGGSDLPFGARDLPGVNAVLRHFGTQEVRQQLFQAAIGSTRTDATSATLVGDMLVRPTLDSSTARTPASRAPATKTPSVDGGGRQRVDPAGVTGSK